MIRLKTYKVTLILILTFAILYMLLTGNTVRDLGYITRPIWDKPPKPFNYINHFDGGCEVHNWTTRANKRKVYDATIISVELDLLELRLRELWDVVDIFVVVESNQTFTGLPKKLLLNENMKRFSWAKEKLRHHIVRHQRLPGESAFDNEGHMRVQMQKALDEENVQPEDIVINSDIDEIPSHHAIDLLRSCDGPPPVVHLFMRTFLYSFEFPQLDDTWRTSVKIHQVNPHYTHSRQSDYLLAGAGWHCTFCFPHLDDFRFKMQAYSHNDRLTNPRMLDDDYIIDKICHGKDIFGMFAEVFNYKDFVNTLGEPKRNHDLSNMPRGLSDFKYLLPGGRPECSK